MDKKEEQKKGAFKTLPLSHDCEFFLVTGISVYACECTPHHILIDNVEYVQADQVAILYDDTPEEDIDTQFAEAFKAHIRNAPTKTCRVAPEKEESLVDDPVFSVMEIARMESISAVERYGMIKEKFTITRK